MGRIARGLLVGWVLALALAASASPAAGAQRSAERAAAPAAAPRPTASIKAATNASSKAATSQAAEANYGPAKGCVPPTLPTPVPSWPPIPALPAGSKPNFIVILTDDQGYDDLGVHQPRKPGGKPTWVNTPHQDRFFSSGTVFDNFYVAPMCSQSRAMLLTGRDYPRTGTMLINGGYDYISREEATAANIFSDAGYDTAHFGKWHNGRTLGYEPWSDGYQDSWLPTSHVHLDNLMRHNGKYVQTKGLMEQDLMDRLLGFLRQREASGKPFYVYYAPHAIHQGFLRPGQGPRWQRPAPEPYRSKYKNMTPRLPGDTSDVWAFLEYMDDVLGRLFDFMADSSLRKNTYVMMMSDNGAELFPGERRGEAKLRRMPSGMQGWKKSVEEGGIRNFLAVHGPGVPAGVVDSTLTSITDVLPTMCSLAGLSPPHLPWDGLDIANLLRDGAAATPGNRGTSKSNAEQASRYVVSMSPDCWGPDVVPALGPDRRVAKPQPLLDFDRGGADGQGFARCMAVRYMDYKWLGATGKVYRFPGQSHIELPCNEVSGPERAALAAQLSGVARQHFNALVSDNHSFNKPTFFLGLDGWSVTNILPDGAHERTPGRVELLPSGAAGFRQVGDSMCFAIKVLMAGKYKVTVFYSSNVQATFKLSVGTYNNIKAGSAPSVTSKLPVLRNMQGQHMGDMVLPTSGDKLTEACFVMTATSNPGSPVFDNLGSIRFTREDATRGWEASAKNAPAWDRAGGSKAAGSDKKVSQLDAGAAAQVHQGLEPLAALDWAVLADSSYGGDADEELHPNLRATPAMKQVEADARRLAALRRAAGAAKEGAHLGSSNAPAAQLAWEEVRQQYGWPAGQGLLESMFTPYESEGIDTCSACQPEL